MVPPVESSLWRAWLHLGEMPAIPGEAAYRQGREARPPPQACVRAGADHQPHIRLGCISHREQGECSYHLLRACALEASHPCSAGQPRSGAKQWELCRCPWVREAQDATWCGRKGVGGRPQSQCEMLRGAERQAVSLCASTVPRDNAPRGDPVFSTCSYTRQWAVRVSNIL